MDKTLRIIVHNDKSIIILYNSLGKNDNEENLARRKPILSIKLEHPDNKNYKNEHIIYNIDHNIFDIFTLTQLKFKTNLNLYFDELKKSLINMGIQSQIDFLEKRCIKVSGGRQTHKNRYYKTCNIEEYIDFLIRSITEEPINNASFKEIFERVKYISKSFFRCEFPIILEVDLNKNILDFQQQTLKDTNYKRDSEIILVLKKLIEDINYERDTEIISVLKKEIESKKLNLIKYENDEDKKITLKKFLGLLYLNFPGDKDNIFTEFLKKNKRIRIFF